MQYWLIKSEPRTYAWADLLRDGKTAWDGVRNFQARNNLRAMRPRDLALYYHSGAEKAVVGVARIVTAAYADPTASNGDWAAVDVEPAFGLRQPVSLAAIKEQVALRDMVLVKQSQLSVQPATREEFEAVVALGGRVRL